MLNFPNLPIPSFTNRFHEGKVAAGDFIILLCVILCDSAHLQFPPIFFLWIVFFYDIYQRSFNFLTILLINLNLFQLRIRDVLWFVLLFKTMIQIFVGFIIIFLSWFFCLFFSFILHKLIYLTWRLLSLFLLNTLFLLLVDILLSQLCQYFWNRSEFVMTRRRNLPRSNESNRSVFVLFSGWICIFELSNTAFGRHFQTCSAPTNSFYWLMCSGRSWDYFFCRWIVGYM